MTPLQKTIFPALFILFFSCRTALEKQGWSRTTVVTQPDTSAINKKDKELHVVMIQKENSFIYGFNIFLKDSSGKIMNKPFKIVMGRVFISDVAYYKWKSDSICLVKLFKNGTLQAEVLLTYFNESTQNLEILKERSESITTQ